MPWTPPDYSDVAKTLAKLKGKWLDSVTGTRNTQLKITSVDDNAVSIQARDGYTKNIRHDLLNAVWEELLTGAPVHVDTAIGGGGERRHQPETLLANLPH